MPKRRRSKSRSRKVVKRRFSRKRKLRIPRGIMAKKFMQSHRYVVRVPLDPAMGALATETFTLNGMYDPQTSIGGGQHQPLLFDQMGALFNHYTVLSASMSVDFISEASGNNGTCIVGIEVTSSSAPTTTVTDVYEQSNAVYGIMTNTNAGAVKRIRRKVSIKKFLGTKNLMDENDVAGHPGSNPVEQVYAHIFAGGISGTYDPTRCYCLVTINYLAIWHEPKKITGS